MIELTAYRGDSMSFTIPLTNGTAAFTPGGSYSLIFTAKRSSKDPDTAAVFQKSTATGTITTSTTNAIVTVLYTDTTTEEEPVLYWDIQAQHNSTAAVITAAKGTLTLVRDITRQTTASVPIYTIDPAAGGGGNGSVTSVATGTGLTGGPVTTTGTIALANTAVTAGVYQAPFIQVDAQGRLTKALDEPCSDEIHFSGSVLLNGSFLTATGVSEWDTPVVSAVARTGIFSEIATATAAVLYTPFDFDETVLNDNYLGVIGGGFTHRFTLTKSELISRSASEIIVRWTGFVSYTTGTILPTRPAICILRIASNLAFTLTLKVQKEFLYTGTSPVVVTGRAISLAASAAAGTYATPSSITVDATGRVTAATAGAGGSGVTSIATGTGLTGGPITTTGTISLSTTLPGAYAFTNVTRPTSSATTATLAAADAQSLITKGDGDARYVGAGANTTITSLAPSTNGGRMGFGKAQPTTGARYVFQSADDVQTTPILRVESNNANAAVQIMWDGLYANTGGAFSLGVGTTKYMRIFSSGGIAFGTTGNDPGSSTFSFENNVIIYGGLRLSTATTPASATAAGTTGSICWDANYIYVCTATNTWKRTAIATW